MKIGVPTITITGNRAYSSATLPRSEADSCSCWPNGEMAKARKLLKRENLVFCEDATAYAAILALSLDFLYRGQDVKAKPVKGWAA